MKNHFPFSFWQNALPPVFLPGAGPFLGLPLVNANNLPNLIVNGVITAGSSRRATPLQYNTVNILDGAVLQAAASDSCIFLRCNHLIYNGVIRVNGGSGQDGQLSKGGNAGSGAIGGGGGGGTTNTFTSGGAAGGIGIDGSAGQSDIEPGGLGGTSAAQNWTSDGYDYVADLAADPDTPFLEGDPAVLYSQNGDDGGFDIGLGFIVGGGSGASAGIIVIQFNLLTGVNGGPQLLQAIGGDSGVDYNSGNQQDGGGGGCILFYGPIGSYPVAILDGVVQVDGGNGATVAGAFTMQQINPNNSLTPQDFSTAF